MPTSSIRGGKTKHTSPHKSVLRPFFEAIMLPRIPNRAWNNTANLYMFFPA